MSARRVAILLKRELLQGPKSFIFLWAIVLPVLMSLVLTLVFGTLFSDKPRVGIADEAGSGLVGLARESRPSISRSMAPPATWSMPSGPAPWTTASSCRRASTPWSRPGSRWRSRCTSGERAWPSSASSPRPP